MARLLPFYRTGGLLSGGGGGGGGPLGDATVWGTVADWTDFGSIPGPLRTGDRVLVSDLVPGFGFAEYDGTDWLLAQAVFPTVADLLAFGGGGELINPGAIAIVGTGLPTDPAYYYDDSVPAWARMADTVPFAWTLSSIDDFSAVGLQDGDYGVFTPSGGLPVVLRYNAAVTRAAGAGSGTVPAWLPPEVYAGTPTLQAYLIGTESAVTLASQGYTISTSGAGGSVSSVGGFVRCTDGNTASSSASLSVTNLAGVITSTTKLYIRFRCRAPAVTGTPFALTLRDGVNVISWAAGATLYVGGSGAPPANVGASFLRGGGTAHNV